MVGEGEGGEREKIHGLMGVLTCSGWRRYRVWQKEAGF